MQHNTVPTNYYKHKKKIIKIQINKNMYKTKKINCTGNYKTSTKVKCMSLITYSI